jgi:hypothetical protein
MCVLIDIGPSGTTARLRRRNEDCRQGHRGKKRHRHVSLLSRPENKTRPTLQTRRDTFRCSHSSSTAMPEIITSPANSAYKSQMLRFDGLINASSDKK